MTSGGDLLKIVNCVKCGKEFNSYHNAKYCSSKCRPTYTYTTKKEPVEKECVVCRKIFKTISQQQKYCSKECVSAFEKSKRIAKNSQIPQLEKQCDVCGNVFFTRRQHQKACSPECSKIRNAINVKKWQSEHNISRKDKREKENALLVESVRLRVSEIFDKANKNEYANDFWIDYRNMQDIPNSTKEDVLRRERYCCYVCGRKTRLHIHHIVKRSLGGTHSIDNLVALCPSCHRHIETGDLEHALEMCSKVFINKHDDMNLTDKECVNVLIDELNKVFKEISCSSIIGFEELLISIDKTLTCVAKNRMWGKIDGLEVIL